MGNPYTRDNYEESEAYDEWAEEEWERTRRHTPVIWDEEEKPEDD